jgi:gliding motility-associated-like protein
MSIRVVIFLFVLGVRSLNVSIYSQCLTNGIDTNKCYAKTPFPPVNFSISKELESSDLTAVYTTPLVIDTDGDCVPEILMSSNNGITNNPNPRTTKDIRIVNSSNGATISTISTAFYSWHAGNSYAVADIDLDGMVEIILAAADVPVNNASERGRLICYELDGTINWISNEPFGLNSLYAYGGTVGLTDFNRDGIPECYIYNEIFNAQSGVKLANGGSNGIGLSRDVSPPEGSLAVGISGQFNPSSFNLELACGYTVYEVVITNLLGSAGNSMNPINMQINGAYLDGYTSMADINLDGNLDVVVSTRGDQNTARLYVYQVLSGIPQLIAQTTMPTGGGPQTLHSGPPFIGDMDGSGFPTIGLTRAYKLLAYRYNGSPNLLQLWDLPTNDASGETGLTMFDFNQDGVQEIVYRDMSLLRIIDASSGIPVVLASFPCSSGTGVERPIVADIHGNGESQICVTCGLYNGGRVEVFSSSPAQQPWAPSRSIWNQYAYHVFNIDNDLTVPANPISNSTFGNGMYNNFFVQMSLVDSTGAFLQIASDGGVSINCVNYNYASDILDIEFNVFNSLSASNDLYNGSLISIYNGSVQNGVLLNQFALPNTIAPGGIQNFISSFTSSSLNLNQGFSILLQPIGLECDTSNNLYVLATPFSIENIDTTICSNQNLILNGAQITLPGIYEQELPSTIGCDSIVRIYHVDISPISQNNITLNSCDSIIFNGTTYDLSGNYTQVLANQYGCDSLLSISLSINNSNFISEQITACSSFGWNGITIDSSGLYTYNFQNQYGCDSVRQIEVVLIPENQLPISAFSVFPIPVFTPDGEVELNNLSENHIYNHWYFSDNEDFSDDFEPVHYFQVPGDFSIRLIVEDANGCLDTSYQQIIVYQDVALYVPNTFTPDGNEYNHGFLPIFSAPDLVSDYHLSIFNRWGELLFESFNKECGWDGTYQLMSCKSDVYTWKITYKTIHSADKQSKVGHITLLK